MGPTAPAAAAVHRAALGVRAVVVWCAALLTALGALVPAGPGGDAAARAWGPGAVEASAKVPGRAAAGAVRGGGHTGDHFRGHGSRHRADGPGGHRAGGGHGENGRGAGTLRTTGACDGQPWLKPAGPAERLVAAGGGALLPDHPLPAPHGCGGAPAPAAWSPAYVRDVIGPDGRAPPAPAVT